MRKYKCYDCEAVFEEDEIATWQESRGEFWGSPCYETMTGCPFCFSGNIEEYNEEDDEEEDQEDDS